MFLFFSGVIPAVVEVLHDDSLILREAATQALCCLTESNMLNAQWVSNQSFFLLFYPKAVV